MQPKIISLGYSLPTNKYTQDEIFDGLGYPKGYRRLFRDSGIDHRYFWLPIQSVVKASFQEQQEYYHQGALVLSVGAIEQCLDGRNISDIGCLSYSSCTGISPGPVMPHYISREMGFSPRAYFTNIAGHGCEGGYPGLKRAMDFTMASGKMSLAVACELASCAYYPEPKGSFDPLNEMELMRANCLFADAASCALVGFDDNWRHPVIVDTETYTNTDYINDLGFVWQNGRLRCRLSRRVPELAAEVSGMACTELLKRNSLSIQDIEWFIIHAAGNVVIDKIRDALGISEEKTKLSRETLRLVGNTSSTSVGITGKRLMSQNIKQGDYALMLSVGPGMSGGATLCQFGETSKLPCAKSTGRCPYPKG